MQLSEFIFLTREVGVRQVFYAVHWASGRVLATGYWLDELRAMTVEHLRLGPDERARVELSKVPIWLVASTFEGWFQVTERGREPAPFDFSKLVPERRSGLRILRVELARVLFFVVDSETGETLGIYDSESDAQKHRQSGSGGVNNLLATFMAENPEGGLLTGIFTDTALPGDVSIPVAPEPPRGRPTP